MKDKFLLVMKIENIICGLLLLGFIFIKMNILYYILAICMLLNCLTQLIFFTIYKELTMKGGKLVSGLGAYFMLLVVIIALLGSILMLVYFEPSDMIDHLTSSY
ncbi:MAG: hypothetical protein ACQERJ_10505 [Bacillota bacterium]